MKITQLPPEILLEIFGHVPRHDQICLVNKQFYDVACKVSDPNITLHIDDSKIIDNNWTTSIVKSTRKISKVDIRASAADEDTCQTIISIVAKFGASITYLRISDTDVTASEFLEILSLIPNAEHLVFSCIDLRHNGVKRRRMMVHGNELNLHKLTKLQFDRDELVQKNIFLAVFDRLPVGVLQELELSNFVFDEAVILLKRQTNIKKLELSSFLLDVQNSVGVLDHMQLESLVISPYGICDNARILSKQTQLKTLSIPYPDTDSDLLNFIGSHLTELEKLVIFISEAPSPSCMAKIYKLRSLKEFRVSLDTDISLNDMESYFNYPNVITSLEYVHDENWNVGIVENLAKSLPQLKVLKLGCSGHCGDVINAVLINFNFIEVLRIIGDVTAYTEWNVGDCFNPKLTELFSPLPESVSTAFISKLIADYPNLRKLQINCNPVESWEFRQILVGFTKLESLTLLGSAGRLRAGDLDYLMDHINNLKYVSLSGTYVQFPVTHEQERRFSNIFGVVARTGDSHQFVMAADASTLDNERQLHED